MKTKRLMTLALLSTFGWSAGSYAVTSHDMMSFDASAPMAVAHAEDGQQRIIIGNTADTDTSSPAAISAAERSAAAQYATNPGGEDVYGVRFTSAPYSISWATPVTIAAPDYYVLDTGSQLPSSDLYVLDTGSTSDVTSSDLYVFDTGSTSSDVYVLMPGSYDVIAFYE
jgi:hypothetical protein